MPCLPSNTLATWKQIFQYKPVNTYMCYYQLSTVLEYDTTYISQSEGSITRGAAEGDTAL